MNDSFLSFIVKDLSICSDNLINIKYNQTFNINCTCGIEYCDHCDYILKCISKCINHEIDYSKKNYRLIHFKNNDVDFENRLIAVLKLLVTNYTSVLPIKFAKSKLFQSFITETNFESFSLDKTASQFGLNKYKFIRLFKQETGLTPNNYVLLSRIQESKNMLKEGRPIFNTAIDCGFYDLSHFYKNFKLET